MDGENACPPEDVGGAPGYEEFLAALADPTDPEHESIKEWIGGSFDPTAFDVAEVNERLNSPAT
ncbi:plasmid pRiA4b ORF-3 family protein (plasmid) [Polaromonas sp. P1-6]|nr:plasmid pRiA4b ORF-3 family protein [Polaromonas sp. P1-6]